VTGFSVRKVARIVNQLVDAGALRLGARDRLFSNSSGRRGDYIDEVETNQDRRRQLLTSRIDVLRAYAETHACRRQTLLAYFEEAIEPCGNCDNCESGVSESVDSSVDEQSGRVRHQAWGEGQVLRIEDGRAVIFFPDAGYRRVDLQLAAEHGLLDWLNHAAR
jgi:ATP-dependent DNA helicase RecQ